MTHQLSENDLQPRVMTLLGIGTVVSYINKENEALVCYSRKDRTDEEWSMVCPSGGPCVFRMVSFADMAPVGIGKLIINEKGQIRYE